MRVTFFSLSCGWIDVLLKTFIIFAADLQIVMFVIRRTANVFNLRKLNKNKYEKVHY